MSLITTAAFAQNVVTGSVKDAATGDPLMGVGVIVSTGGGTVTDANGTYSFTYNGKQMMAMPDNTSTKVCDEFPGYILNDAAKTRCYVREVRLR